jgi:WD40 repeat protein
MRLGQAKLPLAIPDLAGVSIVCVRIDPKGRYIALLSLDNMLRLVRKDTHEIACRLSGVTCTGANACLKCRFSPDGSFISAGSEVGKVNIWRVDTGARVYHNFETFSRECTDVIWSPCDRVLATASLSHRAPAMVYSYDPRAEQSASVQGAEDLVRDALEGRLVAAALHFLSLSVIF